MKVETLPAKHKTKLTKRIAPAENRNDAKIAIKRINENAPQNMASNSAPCNDNNHVIVVALLLLSGCEWLLRSCYSIIMTATQVIVECPYNDDTERTFSSRNGGVVLRFELQKATRLWNLVARIYG